MSHYQLVEAGYASLVELLRSRAVRHPDRVAYTFLQDGETDELHITYGELDRSARDIAAHLQQRSYAGSRALLMYPPGLEYIKAFFGCLYARVIAVPVYPPQKIRNIARLRSIVTDSQTELAMTTVQLQAVMEEWFAADAEMKDMGWFATDGLAGEAAVGWVDPQPEAEAIAFLQYTSGSTSTPKGVMVSHGNLLHNSRMLQHAFGNEEGMVIQGWLPLYHDMGLIGIAIQAVTLGATCILMSPMDFIQHPFRWLSAISRYKVQTSGGPNFAFDLCVRKITDEQKKMLDLSSLKCLFNGAEPIRAETLRRFAAAFVECGFQPEALYPCYGLAEGTLIVSGGVHGALPVINAFDAKSLEQHQAVPVPIGTEGFRKMVSVGNTFHGESIRIVDPETLLPVPDGRVGEIWVKGPSIAQGYWNRPEETERAFHAYTSDRQDGPYLRTGDLGFMHEENLYVTGRCKDLIILRGKNFYPSDIEFTVEQSHPALRPGCSAAFSLEVGTEEKLVVAAELDRSFQPSPAGEEGLEEIKSLIRKAIKDEHQVQPHAIVLLKAGTIPKTSSGKIQRHASKRGFMDHTLDLWGL